MLSAVEFYPPEMQGHLTVYRPKDRSEAIWLHPGEPVFDRLCATLLARHGDDALRGAISVDPYATEPYLFHLAQVSVVRRALDPETPSLLALSPTRATNGAEIIESRLVGLRQEADGTITLCPLEHLLLLRGARNAAPGSIPLARLGRGLTEAAAEWLTTDTLARLVDEHRAKLEAVLPERLDWIVRGFDHKTAELVARRQRVGEEARPGDARAKAELTRVREQQRQLLAQKERRTALLKAEAGLIVPDETTMIAHALILPSDDPEERQRHDAEVEAIAMRLAIAHEEAAGAAVHDVSGPELARRAGLTDWPGFEVRSLRPGGDERAIEVKGRARAGGVEISENEWAKACNLRDRYWLNVVFDCATPRPRLMRVRDPFGRLLARANGSMVIPDTAIWSASEE